MFKTPKEYERIAMHTLRYILGALRCHFKHGHKYGPWEFGMGPNGYYTRFRTCVHCEWIQVQS